MSWSKTERAKKVVKLIVQDYGIVKKDLSPTFDVNEGTYMYRFKLNVLNVMPRILQSKKYCNSMCTLGWVEPTATLGGYRCGDGLWGVQNPVKKGGLGGPRNTTHYVKNG